MSYDEERHGEATIGETPKVIQLLYYSPSHALSAPMFQRQTAALELTSLSVHIARVEWLAVR